MLDGQIPRKKRRKRGKGRGGADGMPLPFVLILFQVAYLQSLTVRKGRNRQAPCGSRHRVAAETGTVWQQSEAHHALLGLLVLGFYLLLRCDDLHAHFCLHELAVSLHHKRLHCAPRQQNQCITIRGPKIQLFGKPWLGTRIALAHTKRLAHMNTKARALMRCEFLSTRDGLRAPGTLAVACRSRIKSLFMSSTA
jgi:hypothetical protein